MRPLSPLKFMKGSLLKALPAAITVCLGVAVLYFLCMFVQQMDQRTEADSLAPLRNVSHISSGKLGLKPADSAKLTSQVDASRMFYAHISDVMFRNVVGNSRTYLTLTEQENVVKMMQAMKLKLAAGRMPEKPGEIVIHKQLAANHGLTVGSAVPKGHKGWNTSRDVTIVGLLVGKSVYSLGVEDRSSLRPGAQALYLSLVVLSEDEQLAETNAWLETSFAAGYDLTTYRLSQQHYQPIQDSTAALEIFVGVILVIVLSVLLANITGIQYAMRQKELELLHAIGYTRIYLIRKALIEIGFSGLAGYLSGIAMAISLCWTINVTSWNDKGLPLPLFSWNVALMLLLVPAAVTLFSMIAPLRLTRFRDIA